MSKEKEKAKELIEKFEGQTVTILGCGKDEGNPCVISDILAQIDARTFALICVDEIIEVARGRHTLPPNYTGNKTKEFYQKVREEITKY